MFFFLPSNDSCCAWVRIPKSLWMDTFVKTHDSSLQNKTKKVKKRGKKLKQPLFLCHQWSLFGRAFNTQQDSHKTDRYAHWVMLPLKAGQTFTTANVTWTCNRLLNVHRRWLEEIVYNAHHCASVCNRQTGYVWTITGHCLTLKKVKGITSRLNASK